jgi:response regulator RpfG family c-di-GMP phosphodiesterase
MQKECKICFIDDQAMAVQDFEEKFQGHNIKAFVDPREAAELINKEQFHVFIVNIKMPYINGIDFCRLIRQSPLNCNAHVIANNCESDEMKQVFILREGFDDFIEDLMKPELLRSYLKSI